MPLLGVATLAATALTNEACLTRACDNGNALWGLEPGQGNLIDANTWESTPFGAEWVYFPHQTRVGFYHPLGRTATEVVVWISAEKRQGPDTNFTLAGGDIAKISDVKDGEVAVTNGTCADYYIRVVVRAAPVPPAPPSDAGDAGDAGDGASQDASSDAGTD